MLNCVYHPVDEMRVVTDEDRDKLLASGAWFDHPQDAKNMREDYEKQIRKQRCKPSKGDAKQVSSDVKI